MATLSVIYKMLNDGVLVFGDVVFVTVYKLNGSFFEHLKACIAFRIDNFFSQIHSRDAKSFSASA